MYCTVCTIQNNEVTLRTDKHQKATSSILTTKIRGQNERKTGRSTECT